MKLWDLGSKIGNTVLPIGIVAGAVEYLYHNRFYTVISVILSSILLWLIWLEIRFRKLESKK